MTEADNERIASIRSSERLFYQKITDIYATSLNLAVSWHRGCRNLPVITLNRVA